MTSAKAFPNPSSPPGLAFAGAVEASGLVFVSGCLGNAPGTSEIVAPNFQAEARQVFDNALAGLAGAGLSAANAVKVTIYLTDLKNFAVMNQLFAEIFETGRVARTTVEVSKLGMGGAIEIDVIAAS